MSGSQVEPVTSELNARQEHLAVWADMRRLGGLGEFSEGWESKGQGQRSESSS